MWLGSAGILARETLFEQGILHEESYPLILAFYRLPVMLTHVVNLLVGYALLRRLLPGAVALLAALLWATDPFVVAFSRFLHVDALMGSFATLSLLAACLAWPSSRGRESQYWQRLAWLAISAVCGALAMLSKLPGLAVVPVVGILALRAWRIENGEWNIGQSMRYLLLWGILFVLTVVVVWPSVWNEPLRVYEALRYGVESEGGQPHMWGNFFLGRAVESPGALFYPVALALRTTPIALAGLLLLPFAFTPHLARSAPRPTPATLRMLAVLAGFIILFVVAMSMFPKKHNRYLVPIFPAVDILAAVGIAWGIEQGARLAQRAGHSAHWLRNMLATLVGVAALLNAAWWHPYGIAAFNQALGGAERGAHTFLTGWGEGFEQVADWLNQQPDSRSVVTVTSLGSALNPYLHRGIYATSPEQNRLPDSAGYVVVYISHAQRHLMPPYNQFFGRALPIHTVTIHGVDYAWVYQVPRTMARPLRADFGTTLRMEGYEIDVSHVRSSGFLTLTAQFQAREPLPDEPHNLFVHVLNDSGQQIAQLDIPLHAVYAPPWSWQPGRYVRWIHPVPVPSDVATGRYWVALGVYQQASFERLPLHVPPGRPDLPGAPDDGPRVLLLEPVSIR
jgi:hypothetical protein